MSKLIRLSLGVAFAAGVFVCAFNTFHLKQKLTRLRTDLRNQTASRTQAETALAKANTKIVAISGELDAAKTELDAAATAMQRVIADADEFKARLVQSGLERLALERERNEVLQELSRYKLGGLEPEQIVGAALYIRELEASVTRLHAENQVLLRRIAGFEVAHIDTTPPLPAGLHGKVLAYDPKWRFIVLDIGQDQGVVPRAELLLSRSGRLVAKVKISRVENDRCIANLLPGFELGEVSEGDVAQPAPSSI
jgi:hypothetical protein